ncbi:MAG: transcription-repair coupling factor [Oscillospiraceae bacterium]|nr:transcription-repair coupling factor [Oscillospiraceae bacterium]
MRLDGLMKPIENSTEYREIKNSINKGRFPIGIFGISESSKAYFIYSIFKNNEENILILTQSDLEARNLYEDLSFFTPSVYYLPVKEVVFYNIDSISGDVRWERLKVFGELLSNHKKIIVTCIESLATRLIPHKLYGDYKFRVEVSQKLDIKTITKKLIECGYKRSEISESKGFFSVRGGIIDIFCPTEPLPYRIELFDDEVDSIRTFNVETQRSIDKIATANIFPAKELIITDEIMEFGYENIKRDFNDFISSNVSEDIKEKITSNVTHNLDNLRENYYFENIDSYMNYFYEESNSFLDYVEGSFVFLDDPEKCKGKLDSVYIEFEETYKMLLQRGEVLPNQGNLLNSKEDLFSRIKCENIFTIDAFTKSYKFISPKYIVNFNEITLHEYHGQLELLIDDIKDKMLRGLSVVILSGTRARGERLVNTLKEYDLKSRYSDTLEDLNEKDLVITFGSQLRGYEFPDLNVCLVSDKEVFGEAKRKLTKPKPQGKGVSKIKSFTELKSGDYIVHANHGIGVYKGIIQLTVDRVTKDFILIEYEKGDKLYVPVEQLDMVQKYIGSEGIAPRINKLGSGEWIKAKKKVKKQVEDMAQDLIKLYAERSTIKGFKFSKDTVWQKQFEDEFEYEETQDQLLAIEDIKRDMETDKVMDRLVCGDVGYGKTEVVIRAAFKAVMDGKQVAILVPTTILAQQHYNNMLKRFSDFPVTIDMISRFRSDSEQKKTLLNLKSGNLDILVGTHRLIQKDIEFKNLGLLIVDEEQRFGVTHKEKIKHFKKNVDVITLSATPIPRTLHMSLVGVRDISVIETPPEERYPIQTYVVEYNDQLIRDAMLKEVSRGGQVYFVHNRVENILEMRDYLSKLVPELRIVVAHGQMNERQLEKVILDFTTNEYDVLLTTTIIETGMDIQNVNTIIMNDADKLGLSQLYQLRGRVGRTNKIAYCYLTYRKEKILTEVAEKRLKAIKDYTELGSGFKIALKDLEIRGAGNIMGSAQHGHMAAVGYDLYCKMLEDAIKILKGEKKEEALETTIEIKVDAYIPSEFIGDEVEKIQVYKKIAAIENLQDKNLIVEELEDRFGNIPTSVNNLINIAYIKCLARDIGIEELKQKSGEILFAYKDNFKMDVKKIQHIINGSHNTIYYKSMETKPTFAYKINNEENLLFDLEKILLSLH